MANKYLRRLMRSGVFFFTSSTARAHQVSGATAANKLKPMQGLSNWNNRQGEPVIRSSVRASHYSCLPLQASHCRPSYITSNEEDDEKQLALSHSCSKLQGKQLVPSFKPLLHNGHCQSCKLHDFPAESSNSRSSISKYTRSSSAPSLHIGRNAIKLPQKARSFSRSLSKDGKRSPKGHVAVYVEEGRERHVVPITYLSHPHFQVLLKRAESEFGFHQQGPGLRIPCSRSELHHTMQQIRTH